MGCFPLVALKTSQTRLKTAALSKSSDPRPVSEVLSCLQVSLVEVQRDAGDRRKRVGPSGSQLTSSFDVSRSQFASLLLFVALGFSFPSKLSHS